MAQSPRSPQARRRSNSTPDASHNGADGTTPVDVVRAAMLQLSQLTGRPADSVSELERTDDGWHLQVEVVELERIPPSTSVLASYEVRLTRGGDLEGYRRTRRYFRNQASES